MNFAALRVLCLLLIFFVVVNDALWWRRSSRRRFRIRLKRCSSKKDCVSCANYRGWSGQCRWCPRDNKCHARWALLTNPCSSAQNVVSASACSSILIAVYDRSLAYKMVYLSALAYADNSASYISKAREVCIFWSRWRIWQMLTYFVYFFISSIFYIAIENKSEKLFLSLFLAIDLLLINQNDLVDFKI